MKIEKINDNQIRCTLTKEDLDSHQIRISELAYGTEKAKRLFRDMMQQAQIQFGFEADNIPLMIEAIPLNAESIILIITKVEDPEELDTRFSKFAPFKGSKSSDTVEIDGADNIIDIFQKLCESKLKNIPQKTEEKKDSTTAPPSEEAQDNSHISENSVRLIRLYTFPGLDDVIAAAHGMNGFFNGDNILYREERMVFISWFSTSLTAHRKNSTRYVTFFLNMELAVHLLQQVRLISGNTEL